MADDEKELKDQRVVTMMSPSELEAIDEWAWRHRIRSRGEAIRRLCKLSIIAGRSDTAKALDGFMDASIALIDVIEAMPEPPEDLSAAASIVLTRMFDTIDAQIADSAKTLPMTSGEGDIRKDLEQVDRMVDFLRGKSVMKLIEETPGMKEKLSQRVAELRKGRNTPTGTDKPDE